MASKKDSSDRSDPKKNKSLAIRNVIKKMPKASAAEVAEAVKREYGHAVKVNMIYMVKTKTNMAATRKRTKTPTSKGRPVGATQWVEAIKTARHLLRATGSVNNATALLKALDG
jgi:hypothetical protein